MAAPRKNASKPDDPRQAATRQAIQTTQLINRLQGFALGRSETRGSDGEDAKPIELDANRIRAIEILLRKSLPDLQAITIDGNLGITITIPPETRKL